MKEAKMKEVLEIINSSEFREIEEAVVTLLLLKMHGEPLEGDERFNQRIPVEKMIKGIEIYEQFADLREQCSDLFLKAKELLKKVNK